jgi:hypothetical protein
LHVTPLGQDDGSLRASRTARPPGSGRSRSPSSDRRSWRRLGNAWP